MWLGFAIGGLVAAGLAVFSGRLGMAAIIGGSTAAATIVGFWLERSKSRF